MYRISFYVPLKAAESVKTAMFNAGAGRIGNYDFCSWETPGTGQFRPLEGSDPAIGVTGNLETVEELKIEMVCEDPLVRQALSVLIETHPYEEPAFDVFKLYNPGAQFGLGRIGKLAKPASLTGIIADLKRRTGAKAVGVVGKSNRTVRTAAVCAGSCGKIINTIIAQQADLYVTGELKHHQALAAAEAGLTCLCLSHSVSERFILKKIKRQLQKRLKGVTITISKQDKDPFTWKQL